ncbi:MAG: YdcF family protein [Alphaproteobacteria bacterium]|nr:YdcF family protein [Alphaproteobacteria bacterium]
MLCWGALAGLVVTAAIGVGFAVFVVPPPPETGAAQADAIVVLTGGSLRLRSGIELMLDGRGRMLFVTGVERRVDLDDLVHLAGEQSPRWLACCVVLGYKAENTLGNAIETKDWMRQQGYHSLRLVTSWYHMSRSLLEFKRVMPDFEIIPHPVLLRPAKPQNWRTWRGNMAMLIGEYGKYLAALFLPFVDRPALRDLNPIGAEAGR